MSPARCQHQDIEECGILKVSVQQFRPCGSFRVSGLVGS